MLTSGWLTSKICELLFRQLVFCDAWRISQVSLPFEGSVRLCWWMLNPNLFTEGVAVVCHSHVLIIVSAHQRRALLSSTDTGWSWSGVISCGLAIALRSTGVQPSPIASVGSVLRPLSRKRSHIHSFQCWSPKMTLIWALSWCWDPRLRNASSRPAVARQWTHDCYCMWGFGGEVSKMTWNYDHKSWTRLCIEECYCM